MPKELNYDRRHFLSAAAVTLAAAELVIIGSAEAQSGTASPASPSSFKPGPNASFDALKQVDAGVLNVGYAEAGPANGPPVILLHGWPYDIYSFVDVAPLLASAGYRVIVPYLRGYGTTRFRSSETFRNAQPSVVALRSYRLDECSEDREGNPRRFRLGSADPQTSSRRFGPSAARPWCPGEWLFLIASQEAGKMPLPPQAGRTRMVVSSSTFATERGRGARLR